MIPTVVIFLGCLPVYFILKTPQPIQFGDFLVFALLLVAVAFEGNADSQMRHHRSCNKQNNTPDKNIETGLWAWSRHPNYFGEIIFWVTIYLFLLIRGDHTIWAGSGVVAMLFLFNVISIPMMEKRLLDQKPQYKNYKKRVSKIIPLPPGKHLAN